MGQAEKVAPDWLNVSRETLALLERFVGLVERWSPAINLVSRRSVPDLWERHVLDSAQLFELVPRTARTLVDLGSGGGFPGLVLAVLAQESHPELRVTLVEADLRKATFLSEAARQLSLRCNVIAERIETLSPQSADVITARALARLVTLAGHIDRHIHPDGVALLLKGAGVDAELLEARRLWSFSAERFASRSDSTGTLLAISDLRHV